MAKNKQQVEPTTEAPERNGESSSRKTVCLITREQFHGAKPLTVMIAGSPMVASVHHFSTGSLGWYLNGRTVVEVDGVPCTVQVGLNLTIVGSKEAK